MRLRLVDNAPFDGCSYPLPDLVGQSLRMFLLRRNSSAETSIVAFAVEHANCVSVAQESS